jgi:DNA polymerase elongation subunit (family B)
VVSYGLHLTIRGAAFGQLEKLGYEIPETNESFDRLGRNYYYGGRCEVFESGIIKDDLYYYDINSAYPHAMLKNHAWGDNYFIDNKLPKNYGSCFIAVEGESAGFFPVRGKNGISFPHIRGVFSVTGWELDSAIRCGFKPGKINRVITPSNHTTFGKYITKFYDLRKKLKAEGDEAGQLAAKLLMNSCYGGFALDSRKWEDINIVKYGDVGDGELLCDLPDVGISLFKKQSKRAGKKFWNVLTAASITGYVRSILLPVIAKNKSIYCDTDSIITRGPATGIKIGEELGEWKVEAEGKEIAIAGKKLYAFLKKDGNFKTASKGVEFSEKEIYRVAKGEVVTSQRPAPSYSVRTGVRFIERDIKITHRK